MEHRFSYRWPLNLQVALYSRGALVARGVCRNVSRDGMFVQVAPGLLFRNALVEVEILAEERSGRLRLPAMVVHCGHDGVGLVFDEVAEPESLQRLHAYLHHLRMRDTV
ncbi:PilZ domain-containing protein [Sulfurivermis fontis]|uniref:PilZ domain-containing protein n=1 Tax=Sulfurivermis fontis TaxID=1972068 RepID=UPI001559B823|nr:PilZ domain-containing protein [Sulfurivermis fontis]